MVSILIRAVVIYLIINFLRNIWRAYSSHKAINKNKSAQFSKGGHESDVVDAEFRELKDDEL